MASGRVNVTTFTVMLNKHNYRIKQQINNCLYVIMFSQKHGHFMWMKSTIFSFITSGYWMTQEFSVATREAAT